MPGLPSNSDNGTTAVVTPKTADDIFDSFKELDADNKDDTKLPNRDKSPVREPKEEKEDKEDKPQKEEGEDDIELVEGDEEEPEKIDLAEQEEDLNIAAPPRKKEILKEFPELFKKFPFLEKMLYRDKEYNEMFGSFDDAKEIAEKAETFKEFENQLLGGNTEEILRGVKDNDQNAFNTIVDNYLPTLLKVDKEAYFHVVGNMNKRLIKEMVAEANSTENDELRQAALMVNQFVFGTSKYTPEQRLVAEKPQDDEVQRERLEFVKERFESARDDLQVRVDNTLKSTISEYIDPKGTMTPFVKKHAVSEAIKHLNAAIAADPSVAKGLDRLWRVSFDSKFSKESLSKIQSFYLGKARVGLKAAIMKARAEALKDSRAPREKDDSDETPEREERTSSRRLETGRTSQPTRRNEMKKGESVTDFFMRD